MFMHDIIIRLYKPAKTQQMMIRLLYLTLLGVWLVEPSFAFVIPRQQQRSHLAASSLNGVANKQQEDPHRDETEFNFVSGLGCTNQQDRRQAIKSSVSGFATLLSLSTMINSPQPSVAAEASNIGTSPDSPIVVLGAGGKVGKLCTQILADKGLYVKATTRSGRQVLDGESKYVSYAPCDVTDDASLKSALSGASGCIFAASASGKKKGGEPIDVDYVGAYKTAKACLDNKVSKLVVVSAGTTTRPDSAGFKATNFFVKVSVINFFLIAKIVLAI
jgi:hypothetical protein